jgi:hypothetical protein
MRAISEEHLSALRVAAGYWAIQNPGNPIAASVNDALVATNPPPTTETASWDPTKHQAWDSKGERLPSPAQCETNIRDLWNVPGKEHAFEGGTQPIEFGGVIWPAWQCFRCGRTFDTGPIPYHATITANPKAGGSLPGQIRHNTVLLCRDCVEKGK